MMREPLAGVRTHAEIDEVATLRARLATLEAAAREHSAWAGGDYCGKCFYGPCSLRTALASSPMPDLPNPMNVGPGPW